MAGTKQRGFWWHVFETSALLAALVGAAYLRLQVLLPAYVPSRSMEPTLRVGDYFLINRLAYKNRIPEPGEIVAFNSLDRKEVWVKRVVAGPGDVVAIHGGTLYRNGRPVSEPYLPQHLRRDFPPVRVPQEHVFVLGDNRDNSDDSRDWGPLHHKFLVGRAFLIYWPRAHAGRL
ncbi:MAG TPA: signal peptidase I [Armatimonadota bacterium]|nr:signal peptidase I [Armatimonadota bacterium]